MLKLIYSVSAKEITLKYHKKSSFLSKTFVLSLFISLSVHALFGLSFKIKPLQPCPDMILLPSRAIAELSSMKSLIHDVQMDMFGFLTTHFEAPQKPMLEEQHYEDLVPFSFEDDLALLASTTQQPRAFESVLSLPPLEALKSVVPIKIVPSENLSERIHLPKFQPKTFPIGKTETLFCQFTLEFDNRNGHLFAIEKTISTGFLKYDQHIEKIVQNLKLTPSSEFFSTKGEVSIYMEVLTKDTYD